MKYNKTKWLPVGGTVDGLKANLLDIHNQRLGFMNANDIDFVSFDDTSPHLSPPLNVNFVLFQIDGYFLRLTMYSRT